VNGLGQQAKATCFWLDVKGCHTMELPGDTHVCKTNISDFVSTIDPYCKTTEWDEVCASEAWCGRTICGDDPYCCRVEWDDVCDDEYAAAC
jgi:hypothetical protein